MELLYCISYAFFSDYVGYTTVSINNHVLFIGGFCGGPSEWEERPPNSIIRYEIDEFTQIGKLLSSRFTHNAIVNGDRIFVIGGIDPLAVDRSSGRSTALNAT